MKDLLERLAALIPAYFADLIALTSRPKQFLETRTSTWAEGLTFLAVSSLLTFVIQLPLARMDPLLEAAADAAFVFAYVVLFGYAVIVSWRMVGGRAPIERFFAIHFYVAGVLKLLMSATFIAVVGLLRIGAPAVYEEMMAQIHAGNVMWFVTNLDRLQQQPVWQAATSATAIGIAVMAAWILTTWGAFRQLNGLTRARSAAAFLIFCLVSLPIYVVVTLLAGALIR